MAITYGGAINFGPVPNATRYYGYTGPSLPNGAWSMGWIIRLHHLTDQAGATTNETYNLFTRDAGGTGVSGNDSWLRVYPDNFATAGSRKRLGVRLGVSGVQMLTSGSSMTGTTALSRDVPYVIVLQRNEAAGNMELWCCPMGGTAILEASAARNAAALNLGALSVGKTFGQYVQAAWSGTRVLTKTEIESIAAGTDLETVYAVGERTNLLLFDAPDATITAKWGSNNATRNGDWTGRATASPVLPNASVRIECAEPVPYRPIAMSAGQSTASHAFSGTYTGFSPGTFQYRIIDDTDGSTAQDWTPFSSFSSGAGTWSGTASIPRGGTFRLQVRDGADTAIQWSGANPWVCCPVVLTMGQSPMVFVTSSYLGAAGAFSGKIIGISGADSELVQVSSARLSSGLAALMNHYHTVTGGAPLAVIAAAVDGTSSAQWAAKDALVWPQMLTKIDAFGAPKALTAYWLNGAAEIASHASIGTYHDTILANLDADLTTTRGIAYRYVMVPHQRHTGASNAANHFTTREIQRSWAINHPQYGTRVGLGPWWGDMQTDAEALGMARGGTSTTITLAANDPASSAGIYANATVTITAGTGAGQTRTAAAGTPLNTTTKVLTITSAWTTIPDATSAYKIVGNSPHPTDIGGTRRFGPRWGQDIASRHGYTPNNGQGPTVTGVTYPAGGDGQTLKVKVAHTHGAALRTPSGVGVFGFEVSDDSFVTTETVASAIITGANEVTLVLTEAPSTPAVKVRYLYGSPVAATDFERLGDLLYDDTSIGDTAGLPVWYTPTALTASEAVAEDTPPTITSTSVKAGQVGAALSYTITATGTAPITFVVSGTLPAGVTFDGTATISGTPTTAGETVASITATNSAGEDSDTLTFTIADAPTPGPTFGNLSLFNQLAEAVGAAGGHRYNLDALNAISQQLTGSAGHTRNLAALNAIAGFYIGTPQAFTLNIDALNAITGDLGGSSSHTRTVDALAGWLGKL